MINRKWIAAVISAAIVSVFLWTGCKVAVNDPIKNVPIFEPYISAQPASYVFSLSEYTAPPVLKVGVAQWDITDGTLGYQWYTFKTLEDFYKDEITQLQGKRGASYTPDITTPAAGDKYYYYVVVTNNNPLAVGSKKSASIKSDVATISFNVDGAPATPVITQNPVNASYTLGRTAAIAALEVRAAVENGSLMYQWYSFNITDGFNSDGTPKGTLIPGANQRTYLPSIGDLGRGGNYFYVVVSNVTVNPEGVITARTDQISVPAVITMQLGEKAEAPRLMRQPKEILYFQDQNISAEDTAKLSVTAVSTDGGTLTYQWYSSASSSGSSPTAVTGATSDNYQPEINTASPGTTYYYVTVTNTNENVTGNTIVTVTSKIAAVKVRAANTLTANATITVDPAVKYQYIRGYGGMETTWGNFFQSDAADMKNMFDPEILGFNIWRIMIPPISTDIDVGMADITSRSYADRYYENVKIVNSYGGYVLASPWSPPKEWKSNNSINSGGHLIYNYRKQYANYLRAYARHMSNQGAPVYAVSIANEPNYAGGYDGCEWNPEEMRDFFKEVGRYTQGVRGFGGGKVTPSVLTVNGESANSPDINHAAMNDAVSNAAIDLFARHVYGSQTERLWGHSKLNGREVWMTEHNINSASQAGYTNDWTWNYVWRFMNDVDLVIRLNNENAFVWWVVKRFYSFIGDGDASTSKGTILPRGWGMAHYSKFTIDTTRIGVNVTGNLGSGGAIVFNNAVTANVNNTRFDLDNPSVKVTAFVSQDGNEISLVMWSPTMPDGNGGYNLGTAEIKMPAGFIIRSASAMRSTSVNGSVSDSGNIVNMGKWEDVSIASDRTSAFITLPRSQMLSVKFIKE